MQHSRRLHFFVRPAFAYRPFVDTRPLGQAVHSEGFGRSRTAAGPGGAVCGRAAVFREPADRAAR